MTVVLQPDLLYVDGRFHEGWAVEYDPSDGRIRRVGPRAGPPNASAAVTAAAGAAAGAAGAADRRTIERLPGRALLPGFVNAHSHAFQRLIRGRTQWKPADRPEADFWSWREAMYAAALPLSPDDVFHVSRACFLEMLHAGWTAVGEFHYLHRDPAGRAYADPNELAHRVIEAAREVGIRIALLNVCYATGDIERELGPRQRRFATPAPEGYLADTEALLERHAAAAASGLVTVGVAPHSVRAVPREWLGELHAWADSNDVAFHIHVSEQIAEVERCEAVYGLRPVELLDASGVVDARLTAVHATHLAEDELAILGDASATVCACPTTERDLGDGFLPGRELLAAGARIALGSDSHTVIDPFEEMRLVEYHERLRRRRRVVLAASEGSEGDRLEVAPTLLRMGAEAGARALRIDAGRLEAGRQADMIAVDLSHRTLAGWTPGSLGALLALSAPAAVVSDVWVGGERRIEDRRHALDQEAMAALGRVASAVE
ncbi:MAG: formimidoylglutamate deiminase [Gemmatimonadota bacterium]